VRPKYGAAVVSLDELGGLCAAARSRNLTIIQCHGCFDFLHYGHLLHFSEAAALGDILVVTVTADDHVRKGAGRPLYGQDVRASFVAALQPVDYVAISPYPTASEAIGVIQPELFVKGGDYHEDDPRLAQERAAVERAGGELRCLSAPAYSSTDLIQRLGDR